MRRTQVQALLPRILTRLVLWAVLTIVMGAGAPLARAQGVELTSLQVNRADGALALEYSARLTLSRAIEDALQRGVPMYFTAHATVLRSRWYWRDERLARVARTWRLSYQPLTASWRVSLGGLAQSFPTLSEALAPMSRVAGWRLLEAEKLDSGERYYVEFSFQLDNSQLPRPMQLDLGDDWKLGIERWIRVE
ncbi:DUF4390 domain-containing protein [Aquincola sp. S2]|uniref:DUF4390 domain-containing protein n=1 Tax=Pseudaquabacterium terrae TaxID=2732868 RepID=A0ABX2EDI0_9BURK|nr:DUF4390 domain-containing protein [Aquabacterium terrae]NRF66197.1 DUF4390 domain-containing protein [Aquabacterium terrae]